MADRQRWWHRPDRPKAERLGAIPLFRGLTAKEIAKVCALTFELDLPPGRVLMREGEVGREFFVIANGKAIVSVRDHELATLVRGSFCGELSLLDRGHRTATVTAVTPISVVVMSTSEFFQLMDSIPTVGDRIVRQVCGRMRSAVTASVGARELLPVAGAAL
jgi:CRP-like cAMP-binding protein